MEYETPDGSQFSLREVWRNGDDDLPEFARTTISATVDGKAFFGRLDRRVDDVDEGDVLSALEAVPPEAIYPVFDKSLTEAPAFDPVNHYLKAPSYDWEDCQPGVTFGADRMLDEIRVLERLKEHQHPNLVVYHGCVVQDGRITHICLGRCESDVIGYFESNSGSPEDVARLLHDVEAGVLFLHSLSLAHNDITPENTCVANGRAVVVDFDSCIPYGQRLMKGTSIAQGDDGYPISSAQNDLRSLDKLDDFLTSLLTSDTLFISK